MMNGALIAWLIYAGVVITALYGWVMNIITIAHAN